jgi:ERCC4-type nuclease
MIIKIDCRERELFSLCQSKINSMTKYKDIQLVSENLPLGDIILNDGINDCLIIERKTLNDLHASIRDGRYEEQSYRLNGLNHHNHNIVYLIEGDLNHIKHSFTVDKTTLYSAMFSIHYFKGFSVMRTLNIDETACYICNSVYKMVNDIKKGKKAFYSNSNHNIESSIDNSNIVNTDDTNTNTNANTNVKDYCSVIKKVKKDNITVDNIGEIMLCQIPGISSTTAVAILQHFKTLPNLISCIQTDDSCLNNICTQDSNGKSRKISKSVITKIFEFLKVKAEI